MLIWTRENGGLICRMQDFWDYYLNPCHLSSQLAASYLGRALVSRTRDRHQYYYYSVYVTTKFKVIASRLHPRRRLLQLLVCWGILNVQLESVQTWSNSGSATVIGVCFVWQDGLHGNSGKALHARHVLSMGVEKWVGIGMLRVNSAAKDCRDFVAF